MRELMTFALLLTAAAGYRKSNLATAPRVSYELMRADTVDREPAVPTENSTVATTLTSITAGSETDASTPLAATDTTSNSSDAVATTDALPPALAANDDHTNRRRVITYDQRQEGQYNIRADLENFMIVLIPSGQESNIDLLHMLTKSAQRRSSPHGSTSKRKRTSLLGHGTHTKSYLQGKTHGTNSYAPKKLAVIEPNGAQQLPDFIEGRTPYHVDISSSDDEQARLQPDRQVDVLPPPYLPQLIKPYHLEAEPTVIQALPPADIASSVNYLDGYGKLLATPGGYYRHSRAIRGDSFLDTNRLGGNKFEAVARSSNVPILRTDLAAGGSGLYPPIDAPVLTDFLGNNYAARSDWHLSEVGGDKTSQRRLDGDLLDLELLNADSDIEFVAPKSLLSDGLERCAPGHRRDSYGVCREIVGY